MEKRIRYIDIAKGFTMLLVILGHNDIPSECNKFIFSFHMPLFFILSGFFLKSDGWETVLKKGWLQLLRPYLFTCLCVFVFFIAFQTIQHVCAGNSYDVKQFCQILRSSFYGDIGPVWFLLSLFWAKVYIRFFLSLKRYTFSCLLILASLGFVIGNYVPYMIPCQLISGMIAALYVYIGYLMKRYDVFDIKISKINLIVVSFIAFLSSPAVVLAFTYNFPLKFFSIVTSSIIAYLVIYNFRMAETYRHIKAMALMCGFFNYVGRNTLVILCVHTLEMSFNLWKYLPEIGTPAMILLKLSVLCCIPLLTEHIPVVNRLFRQR